MTSLQTCSNCGGFVPARLLRCPHCDRDVRAPSSALGRATKACLKVATGGAVAMTLMACYGGPPHAYGPPPPPPDPCQGNQAATDPNCAPEMASPPGAPPPQGQYAEPPPAAVIAQ